MKILLNDYTVISGYKFEELPSVFSEGSDNAGVRYSVVMSSANSALFTTFKRKKLSPSDVSNQRNALRQEFLLQYENTSLEFKNLLNVLYTTGASFTLQLDGIKSKEYALCYRAEGSDTTFFTPDYPIVSFGDTPFAPETYANDIFLTDGITSVFLSSGFQVDNETGMITFDHPIADNVEVFMRYTWRCPVRITSLQFTNVEQIAQLNYNISMTVTQTKDATFPIATEDTVVNDVPVDVPTGLPSPSTVPPSMQKYPD